MYLILKNRAHGQAKVTKNSRVIYSEISFIGPGPGFTNPLWMNERIHRKEFFAFSWTQRLDSTRRPHCHKMKRLTLGPTIEWKVWRIVKWHLDESKKKFSWRPVRSTVLLVCAFVSDRVGWFICSFVPLYFCFLHRRVFVCKFVLYRLVLVSVCL